MYLQRDLDGLVQCLSSTDPSSIPKTKFSLETRERSFGRTSKELKKGTMLAHIMPQ